MRTWRPISRILRYNYGVRSFASVELDHSKPEPPNGFLFNEKVNEGKYNLLYLCLCVAIVTKREEAEGRLGGWLSHWYGHLRTNNCTYSMETNHKVIMCACTLLLPGLGGVHVHVCVVTFGH